MTSATQDMEHVLHPWADLASLGRHRPLVISSGRGYEVFDTAGNRFVDGIGGMWCNTVGYANREIAETMRLQAEKLCYYTPFGDVGNEPAASLAAVLAKLALRT